MSADGPVSTPAKKTAVKPSAPAAKPPSAQKALPASQPAKKALPSSVGSQKALPAPSQKSPATPKPNTRSQSATAKSMNRPVPNTRPAQNNKPGGPTAAKTQGPVGVSKPGANTNKSMSKSSINSSGKTVISDRSRPKPTAGKAAAARGTSAPAKGGDILGIGNNFGDINKTGPKNSQSNNKSGAARKPSAGDPLALGDLENIGKKK